MSGDATREAFIAKIPRWYSGRAHWALINVLGAVGILFCVRGLETPRWWHWLFVPAFFVFANWFEWWIHRGPMHHPTKRLRLVYQRHALEHHVIFTDATMGLRTARELIYVLFPWWALPALLVLNLPIPVLLSVTVSPNLGFLFYLSVLAYYLVYEWFHVVHHVPADTWIGRRAIVTWVREHHTRHHELARMTQGNFNVSFPLWDWILGTVLPPPTREPA